MNMKEKTLEDLAGAILEKTRSARSLAVCVGPGLSIAAGMPSWNSLVSEIVDNSRLLDDAREFKKIESEFRDYTFHTKTNEVLEFVAREVGKEKVIDYIRGKTDQLQPTELHL